ncbi:hypothetical protein AB0J86_32335 [Micromonospora sp. NPDC049559]|uniref:hypothetical protein n=1 Tax=Micromonospora sp. NPDC049559 TaxID=3155923 RepID=UPI0034306C90
MLVLHGLQTRAGAHRPRSTGQSWPPVLRLAALLLLAYATAASLAETGRVVPRMIAERAIEYPQELLYPLGTAVAAVAVVTVARGRYVAGLLATLGALAATLAALFFTSVGVDVVTGELHYPPIELAVDFAMADATFWPLPLALPLLVPLILWRATGTRRSLAWLLAVPVAVLLLPTDYEVTIGVQPWATLVVMVGFLLWIVVDARVTIAASLLPLSLTIAPLTIYAQGGLGQPDVLGNVWFWMFVVGAVVLLTAGTVGLHRQARI